MMLARKMALSLLVGLTVAFAGCDGGEDVPQERLTVIGPGGGEAASWEGNARIQVPANALEGATLWVRIEQATEFTPDAAIIPGSVYSFSPADQALALPATVTIRYDRAELPTGVVEADLRLARFTGGIWQPIPGSAANVLGRSVSAQVTNLGLFAIRAGSVPVAANGAD